MIILVKTIMEDNMTHISIFLVGDSTVSNYDESVAPRKGWGQVFGKFLDEDVTIYNQARSGRSSKSFIHEGHLSEVERLIQAGDYLLIQFGHNDSKPDKARATEPFTSYQDYLRQYIKLAKDKHAFPILITPVQRRSFNDDGHFYETHEDYPNAMKQIAQTSNVPLIDLTTMSRELYERLGPEESKKLFLWFKPGENDNYPDGIQDDTHFSTHGANEIAKLIIQGLRSLDLPLTRYIKH